MNFTLQIYLLRHFPRSPNIHPALVLYPETERDQMPQFQILLAALPAGETWSCSSSFKYNKVLKEACQHISVLYTYTWVAGTSLTAQLPQTIVYSTLCVSHFTKSQSFTLQQRSYIFLPEKKKLPL